MGKTEQLVPKLRFPGFEGEWERNPLIKVVEKPISYGIVQAGVHIENGMPYIKSQDLNRPLELHLLQRTSFEIAHKYRRSEVTPGDIIFSLRGNIGVSQLLPQSIKVANLTQGTARISVSKHFSNRFVQLSLQTEKAIRIVNAAAKGSTFQEISLEALRKVQIDLPTLPEQEKIAGFLSSVDTKLQQLRAKKDLLSQYKKGLMQQLFSGELRFKDEKGKDFPDWEEKRLGDVAEIVGGGTPDTLVDAFWDGGISWFTPTEISERFVGKSKRTISKLGLEKSSAKMLPTGTILFTSRATVGQVSFASEPCCTNQGFQSLIANKAANKEFLFYWIIQNKKEFLRKSQGSTFLEISKNEMVKIGLNIPSLAEQQKIATFLSALDKKIETVGAEIAGLTEWKKGLLQQLFV
ncbi:MAG: restriction endonuclease subunit S [Bacteroidia bacterium]|nr:restriction endonuclease subunit S [Bacteroidia bacterium]